MDLALHAGAVYPSLTYRPRQPDQKVLHKIVRDHYETFRAQAAGRREGQGLPAVDRSFDRSGGTGVVSVPNVRMNFLGSVAGD